MHQVVYTLGELAKILTKGQRDNAVEALAAMLSPCPSRIQMTIDRDAERCAQSVTIISEDIDFLSKMPVDYMGFERSEPTPTTAEFDDLSEHMCDV